MSCYTCEHLLPDCQWTTIATLNEKQFISNKMFFLDTVYLNTYLAKRSIPPHFNDTSLQVWIHNSQTSIEYKSTEKADDAFINKKNQGRKDWFMQNSIKFVHTNLIAKDWKRLSKFYCDVFECKPTYPERDLSGEWLDKITEINGARIRGMPQFARL
jgi:hypothetical protein